MKRSSCASGSGKVPAYSIGFWVAMTTKGWGRGLVSPSTVTWRSSIASSRAAWGLGVARLDSAEGAVEGAGQRLRQQRLPDARDVLDQEVAVAEQGGEAELDLVLLADDGAPDVGEHGFRYAIDRLQVLLALSALLHESTPRTTRIIEMASDPAPLHIPIRVDRFLAAVTNRRLGGVGTFHGRLLAFPRFLTGCPPREPSDRNAGVVFN